MRILVMSIAEGWDLPDRLVADGHTVVAWVRPSWGEVSKKAESSRRSLTATLAKRVNARRRRRPSNFRQLPSLAERLDALGIPRIDRPDCNSEHFVREVRELEIDLIIVAGYPTILSGPLLGAPKLQVINCHYSLLPAYRGPQPVFWAIRNGETRTGVSVHVMTQAIDKGPLLGQVVVQIFPEDSAGSLLARLGEAAAPLVAEVVRQIARGEAVVVPSIADNPSYYGGRTPKDVQIDWNDSSAATLNQLRAVSPWDQLECTILGLPVEVRNAHAMTCADGRPGQVVSFKPHGVTIRTGDGALVLTEFELRVINGFGSQGAAVFLLHFLDFFSVLV